MLLRLPKPALAALVFALGCQGPTGPQGAQGAKGDPGTPGSVVTPDGGNVLVGYVAYGLSATKDFASSQTCAQILFDTKIADKDGWFNDTASDAGSLPYSYHPGLPGLYHFDLSAQLSGSLQVEGLELYKNASAFDATGCPTNGTRVAIPFFEGVADNNVVMSGTAETPAVVGDSFEVVFTAVSSGPYNLLFPNTTFQAYLVGTF